METSQEHAPLATGSLSGSAEALVPPETTRGVSNKRAFKIAGLTTLACLLLASQVFTAYLVFNQNKQIDSLQSNGENMRKELKNTRSRTVPAVQMRMPMNSMPLLMDFTEDEAVADTEPMTNLEQVKDLLQNSQLPQFNETFLANLQSLKEQMEESEWKGFESWMRHWLIFQMAQQAPAPPTQKAPLLQTKCQVEAAVRTPRVLGAYKPQCDELGNYMPMQCHPSTGYCWCVDKSGTEIAGSSTRGTLDCNRAARRMMAFPKRMQLKAFSDGALFSDE